MSLHSRPFMPTNEPDDQLNVSTGSETVADEIQPVDSQLIDVSKVDPNEVAAEITQDDEATVTTDENTNSSGGAAPESEYLADWSKGFNNVMFGDASGKPAGTVNSAGKDIPISKAIADYNKWAKENNGESLDAFTLYPMLSKYDATKSLADNEKEEKKRKRQERWQQIGNVLSHIGNFVGTAMGAPNQQTLEDPIKLTERQKKLRDDTIKQRQLQASDMLKIYYQDIANKRAEETQRKNAAYQEKRLQLQQQQQDRLDAELYLNQKKLDWQQKREQGKLDLEKEKLELQRAVSMGRLSQGAARIALAQMNYDLRAAGTESTTTRQVVNNMTGKVETLKTTVEKKPKMPGVSGGNRRSGDNRTMPGVK